MNITLSAISKQIKENKCKHGIKRGCMVGCLLLHYCQ